MQLTAKLIQLLPIQTGTGKNGEWKKQDIIVETEGQYPKKVCVSIWGDKINNVTLTIGSQYTFDLEIESREFSGRWYTDIKAWRITAGGNQNYSPNQLATATPLQVEEDDDGGLPF